MSNKPLVSLCIPTNGVLHWVMPVLESIYVQNEDKSLFEVIVCDNGNNKEFEKAMVECGQGHSNFIYKKSDAFEFLNVVESFKLANGCLIKFINHRTKLMPKALEYYINFAKKYKDTEEKPIIYFSNSALKNGEITEYNNFADFVTGLGIYSSWSTGMTIWKEDLEKMPENIECNRNFPHTTILFYERKRHKYIIDDTLLLDEIPQGNTAKGGYDLFYYFTVAYPSLLLDLVKTNDITVQQFLELKRKILYFCVNLGVDYFILKKFCSYDLSSFNTSINVFFCKKKFLLYIFFVFIKRLTLASIKFLFKRK